MIETKEALSAYLQPLIDQPEALCAVDTEADSLYRYAERLCLIQISDGQRHELIDPLAIDDLSELATYLSGATTWMHGADYDITMLRTALNVTPPTVYDTQIAARLLGSRRFGYGNLVEDFLGVKLSKSSQKADWGQRPLTPKMSEYALNDVVYLFPLADILVSQLKDKGRYDWFVESCEVAKAKVLERQPNTTEAWRINGSGRLQARGLSYLRALWTWRDREAAEWDKPSFMVLTNKDLIAWSELLAEGKRPKFPERFRAQRRQRLTKALRKADDEPKADWPQKIRGKRRRLDEDFDRKVAALQKVRDAAARDLDIDPSLIVTRAAMESLCLPDEYEPADPQAVLMSWQRALLNL